ncbi:PREDICTED: probable receptor-like protein kinase At1g67000-like [Fragaria vesca subsp. vesca]
MGISGRSFAQSAWVLMVAFLACSSKTCSLKYCTPSSCGNIPNISYPFRLKHDPETCGKAGFTLLCENNITVLDLPSLKYHVQAINYSSQTIRVVDPGFQENNCSSVPVNPPTKYDPFLGSSLYNVYYSSMNTVTERIYFLKCSERVNMYTYVDTAACTDDTGTSSTGSSSSSMSQPRTFGYLLVDDITSGDVVEGCSLEWQTFITIDVNDYNHTDIKRTMNSLAYGFEVLYLLEMPFTCGGPWSINYKCFPHTVAGYRGGRDYITMGLLFLVKFIVGFPFVIAFLVYIWRRRHLSMYITIEDFLHEDNNFGPIRYSYSEIKRMSNGFKDELGKGGYGSVFKGKLRSGRFGAIKMLHESKSSGDDFVSEVATIGRIHHVNVVQLVGYCVEGSKRALVYEYMPKGSLDKYIYSKEECLTLSCKKMFQVSLGVAYGIDYLHQGCDMQILHFDIKPHNILLDENFIPKVSDFGLAKLYPTENSIVSLTAARGTMGYIAPELFYKNIGGVSYKADVYSFGMLLMEMASRRKNFKELAEHESQTYFPSWVYDQYNEGNYLKASHHTEDENNMIQKMVITALWCIQMKPSDRPSMNKVIEMLEGDVENLQLPPRPLLYPQQTDVTEQIDNNLNPTCSNVELTMTLSAR